MKQVILKSGATLLIREAKGSDAKEILEYINKISNESDFLTFGQGEFIKTVEQEEEYLGSVSRLNNAIYLVAEIDARIVGTLSFSGGTRPRVEHIGEFSVTVLKEYWGNGIGTELIKYFIKRYNGQDMVHEIFEISNPS